MFKRDGTAGEARDLISFVDQVESERFPE